MTRCIICDADTGRSDGWHCRDCGFDFTLATPKFIEAFQEGKKAREQGWPRRCRLIGEFTYGGRVLSQYKDAWEQGFDSTNWMQS